MTKILDQTSATLLDAPSASFAETATADLPFEARVEFNKLMESWEGRIEGYLDAGCDIPESVYEIMPRFLEQAARCLPARFCDTAQIALADDNTATLTWRNKQGEEITVAYDTADEAGAYFLGHEDSLEFVTVDIDTLSADAWRKIRQILIEQF